MVLDIQYVQLDVDGSESGIKVFGFRTGRKYPIFTDTNGTNTICYYFVSCLESMLSHWSYVLFRYVLPTLPADWRCVSWCLNSNTAPEQANHCRIEIPLHCMILTQQRESNSNGACLSLPYPRTSIDNNTIN